MGLASPRVVNIKDLRRLARARLPDAVFDYLDGAADDEVTLRDSERAFREVLFKPRFAVATPACDLGVTVSVGYITEEDRAHSYTGGNAFLQANQRTAD